MPSRQYSYQYETSPRKIKPDYNKPKRNSKQYNKSKPKVNPKKQVNRKITKNINNKQENLKAKNALIAKTKAVVFLKCALLFLIVFLMIFMNSKISEAFSQIQSLKAEITEIQKENDQLEINIQNNINLNNIEQAAKELLGMQKLSNKQTFYISLPKKDFVEARTEKVIIEEQTNFLDSIIKKVKNIFY